MEDLEGLDFNISIGTKANPPNSYTAVKQEDWQTNQVTNETSATPQNISSDQFE